MTATKVSENLIQVGAATIVGEIRMWPTGTPPTGWLLCNNQAVSRTVTYDALFAVIGTTYGVGDGSTTFNVPDFRGRLPVGAGTGDASDATAFALADKDGTETHVITEAELDAHTHGAGSLAPDSGGAHTHTIQHTDSAGGGQALPTKAGDDSGGGPNTTSSSNGAHVHTMSGASGSTGSGTAHNNLQPSLGVNFIIKT
jgi:microcystin-dependent protein